MLLDLENFNEAEDLLFKSLDRKNPENFKLAILFYQQFNEYSDEMLEKRLFLEKRSGKGWKMFYGFMGRENSGAFFDGRILAGENRRRKGIRSLKEFFSENAGAYLRYHDLPGEEIPILFVHGLGCAGSFDYPEVVGQKSLVNQIWIP